ncbi:MAG: hypothetical protein IPP97_28160 [Candidatus Obscuribacter sp.]|jgi:hypothetical protein|nr:hypothetical protein [Candidatus Obscuribacter sp.]MBP6594290.1 hypothetical protein [Candidatus Obscuribacter sp.]MBP7577854.1 hypothetical protein [Candidatus Obscuribacter sp.]MDQ5964045.1 hypothetical protein [Cyanobacteriota bacterium erpe_2018_sw_39hr_WHONDRS-SW48-000098_B_bin.30]
MPSSELSDNNDNNAANRCVKELGKRDDTTWIDKIWGDTRSTYTKQIVSPQSQGSVEAEQQLHTSHSSLSSSGWAETRFSQDGNTYNAEHKGRNLDFKDGDKRALELNDEEYSALEEAYKQISKDFAYLPKCELN